MTTPQRLFISVCLVFLTLAMYWSGAYEGENSWRDVVVIVLGGIAVALVLRLYERRVRR